MRSLVLAGLSLALLSAVAELRGGEFASPKGFTITYPEGWKVATKQENDLVAKSMGGNVPALAAFLYGPRQGDFADNINVLVLPQTLTLDDKTEKELVDGVKNGMGKKAANFTAKRIEINGNAAVSIGCEVERKPQGDFMRIWQVHIPGKKQVYVFTCATLKPHWAEVWPTFKDMVYGARIDVATDSKPGPGGPPRHAPPVPRGRRGPAPH
jgi:hypothetical protein